MKKTLTIIVVSFVFFSFIVAGVVYGVYKNDNPKTKVVEISYSLPEWSRTDLVCKSDLIIRGTVKDILPSKWSNPNFERGNHVTNTIQTDISIDIDEVFKGTPYNNKNIIVRINKGKVGNTEYVSKSIPDFKIGDEVLLYLTKDDSDLARPDENYYVTGIQAKYDLKRKEGSEKIFACFDGNEIVLSKFKGIVKQEIEYRKAHPIKEMTKEEIQKNNEKVLGK